MGENIEPYELVYAVSFQVYGDTAAEVLEIALRLVEVAEPGVVELSIRWAGDPGAQPFSGILTFE